MATQQGHSVVTETFVGLLAVAVFAILAGMSDDMGKLVLVIMWGIVIGWMLLHTSELSSMVKAL